MNKPKHVNASNILKKYIYALPRIITDADIISDVKTKTDHGSTVDFTHTVRVKKEKVGMVIGMLLPNGKVGVGYSLLNRHAPRMTGIDFRKGPIMSVGDTWDEKEALSRAIARAKSEMQVTKVVRSKKKAQQKQIKQRVKIKEEIPEKIQPELADMRVRATAYFLPKKKK